MGFKLSLEDAKTKDKNEPYTVLTLALSIVSHDTSFAKIFICSPSSHRILLEDRMYIHAIILGLP